MRQFWVVVGVAIAVFGAAVVRSNAQPQPGADLGERLEYFGIVFDGNQLDLDAYLDFGNNIELALFTTGDFKLRNTATSDLLIFGVYNVEFVDDHTASITAVVGDWTFTFALTEAPVSDSGVVLEGSRKYGTTTYQEVPRWIDAPEMIGAWMDALDNDQLPPNLFAIQLPAASGAVRASDCLCACAGWMSPRGCLMWDCFQQNSCDESLVPPPCTRVPAETDEEEAEAAAEEAGGTCRWFDPSPPPPPTPTPPADDAGSLEVTVVFVGVVLIAVMLLRRRIVAA